MKTVGGMQMRTESRTGQSARWAAPTWLAVVGLAASPLVHATNGYFQHGYGNLSKAMAGVAYALPQDSLIAASNPAGLALIGTRFDFGVDWFAPERGASIEGNRQLTLATADGSWDGDDIDHFHIPELGYSAALGEALTVGIALYGNGGMNTNYSENPYGGFGASGHAGVDLSQMFVSPALAWQITPRNAIGLAVNVVYQRFKAYGLDVFATESFPGPYSESPEFVTSNGYDDSFGVGYRLGWLGEPIDGLTLGLSWQPKTKMSKFDDYKGLFADQGSFDIPENYGGGIAYRWRNTLVVAADVQRIRYDAVKSVGTPLRPFVDGALLGADDGPGFGWRAMTTYKLGAAWQVSPKLRVSAGYSYGEQPVPQDQTLFNILAPGVIEEHYTAGFTYGFAKGYRVSLYYMYAPEVTVRGQDSIPPNRLANPLPPASFGGGEADVHLSEQSLGLAIGYQFEGL